MGLAGEFGQLRWLRYRFSNRRKVSGPADRASARPGPARSQAGPSGPASAVRDVYRMNDA